MDKASYLDIRVTFDKELITDTTNIKNDKTTNLDDILKVEEVRKDIANRERKALKRKRTFIIISTWGINILIVGLFIFVYFKYGKSPKANYYSKYNREFIEDYFSKNQDKKAVFISGATIFEAGFDKIFDKILLIDAPYKTKLERIIKRDNLSLQEAKKRLKAQKDNSNKTKYVIINDSTREELKKKLENILKTML